MVVKGKIRIEKIIANMETGDQGFINPGWSLILESNEDMYGVYLNTSKPVKTEKSGTYELYIRRISAEKDGFEVNLDTVTNHSWRPISKRKEDRREEEEVYIGKVDMF